ncbi:serine hydroxymethyltransferase [Streptomyces solincola]|uniref:Serine hydroxymethyltransferase n=1 Tax=Streptomyces solincola TaxID=2100817 RepID=A0A2S9PZE6_9ACTN|nr:serine hydroxymethyltransferase [Streptomyces solincola]PRH79723.1 serine hydroxymethyltransferase [Streptomyces solincola]
MPVTDAADASARGTRGTPDAADQAPPSPAYGPSAAALARQDPELAGVLDAERRRQAEGLQLVAAENFASPAVLAALASPLADKYAEGYPGARHHGGCEAADEAERIAAARARALFGAGHANVQPHSGSSAVLAAYAALLRPGDAVLALGLRHGGHLTHGSPANLSGRCFDFTAYRTDPETGLIDYAQVRELAREIRPRALVCGSISYPRHPDYAAFREIADEVGALLIVDAAHPIGLVAGGSAPSPVPYADVVCATTHKVLRGPRGGMLLCGAELAERMDRAVFPFTQSGAQMHTVAAKAVAFGEAATADFSEYTGRVVMNARALAGGLAERGVGIVTGGTDTHLIVADPAPLGVDGRAARARLAAAGIVLDSCALPYGDGRRGLRLGAAAVTTQGMGPPEMAAVAELCAAALLHGPHPDAAARLRGRVRELASAFPRFAGTVAGE